MITPREDPLKKFHQLYQKGLFCDFSIVTNDKVTIRMHAIIFHLGSENMVSMFSDTCSESGDRLITLDFSAVVIKAMIDFLYLGPTGLTLERILNERVDMNELFHLANFFDDQSLINHCVSLIDLLSTKDSLEELCLLTERYDNEHLKKLVAHFSSIC